MTFDENGCHHPLVNSSSALASFRHLRARKHGAELKQLTLYVGDWGRYYGNGLHINAWQEGRAEKYECSDKTQPGEMIGCTRMYPWDR